MRVAPEPQSCWERSSRLSKGGESHKPRAAEDLVVVAKVSPAPAPSSAVTAEVELTADPGICISRWLRAEICSLNGALMLAPAFHYV